MFTLVKAPQKISQTDLLINDVCIFTNITIK